MEKIFSKTIFPKAPGGDIYDFQKINTPFHLFSFEEYFKAQVNNVVDVGEVFNVVHDFEIQIIIKETIHAG